MNSEILSIIAIVISITSSIINMINHTRIRSHCCDRKMEMSFDIDRTSPPAPKIVIKDPPDESKPKD